MFIGPFLGGLLTDKLSWRWCFYVNLPIGLVTILGVLVFLRIDSTGQTQKVTFKERVGRLDYIGPVLFIPAIFSLLLALQFGGSKYAWNSAFVIVLFIGCAVLTCLWIYSQYRLGERASTPIRLIMERTVMSSSISIFFTSASLIIPLYYTPLFFQAVKGATATGSAIDTLAILLSTIVASIVAGLSLEKIGYYTPVIILSGVILSIGTGLFSLLKVDTQTGQWIGYEIVVGVGSGLSMNVTK